jgi:hypothetical protein
MTLRRATELILAAGKNPKITHLADDWQLSKSATKTRQLKRGKGRKRKRVKPAHIAADRKKSMMLSKNNDELHEFFKANRERRERRRSWTN